MGKDKFKASIFFTDQNGENRFLFKIVNYGKATDELKFIFMHPKSSEVVLFNTPGTNYPEDSILKSKGELSYHSDGSLLWKLPMAYEGKLAVADNPHGTGSRRTPLASLRHWEPVVQANIIRYNNCFPQLTDDAQILPTHPAIFNGDPFEYHIYLGHMQYANPSNSGEHELIFRVNDIGQGIDMVIWVRKSDYSGESFQLGKATVWRDSNRIRISEPKLKIENGEVIIDLITIWNGEWYGDVVAEGKRVNLKALSDLKPMTKLVRVNLKNNPRFNQLIDLVGFNKAFIIAPVFDDQPLPRKLAGILDMDEKGEFLGIGTGDAKG